MTAKGIPNLKNSKPKVEITCQTCGKVFQVQPYRSAAKYCSRTCQGKALAKMTGALAPHWKGHVDRICIQCGKTYSVELRRANKTRYCSHHCQVKYINSGARCNFWKGGNQRAYPYTFDGTFKTMIRKRDNYICAICHSSGNHVHHIDYNKANTTPENCTTLCNHCHGKTNLHREYWQHFFYSLYQ